MRSPFVFGRIGRTYRNVVRLRRILEVLRAEGFGYVVVRMNLHKLIRFPKRLGARFVAGVGPRIYGYPVPGVVGFVVAGVLGLSLAVAMLRSGGL